MHPSELIRQLEAEFDAADRDVAAAHKQNLDRAIKIRKLTKQQTDAFVELSRHYLPDLTHRSLADAWTEVSQQIRDLLLQKNDKRRQLRSKLQDVVAKTEQLERELDSLREQLDDARHVLACKSGNYRKDLRDDPSIKTCTDSISQVDADIEICLRQLDVAKEEAASKLPKYEESSLFRYLQEREFGTPSYKARGLERRWDRWIAKLIGYRDAKKSFEFLRTTPGKLHNLIDEKQTRYRELLKQLDQAREAALQKSGVKQQTKIWQSLRDQVKEQEEAIEQSRWKAACLQDEIHDLEHVNGDYYRDAIEIYRQFLVNLDPEILQVYAACTPSPIDDEICARLRGIQSEIADEQNSSSDRSRETLEREKYGTAIRDLRDRLRVHLHQTPADVSFYADIDLPDILRRIEHRDMTPDYAWRIMRASMVRQPTHGAHGDVAHAAKVGTATPVEACYLAAADDSVERPSAAHTDPVGIVLLPEIKPDDMYLELGFTTVAICALNNEAAYINSVLASHSITSFAHTYMEPTDDDEFAVPDEVYVMVPSEMYGDSREHLVRLQQELGRAWICSSCRITITAGHALCWRCGERRPNTV